MKICCFLKRSLLLIISVTAKPHRSSIGYNVPAAKLFTREKNETFTREQSTNTPHAQAILISPWLDTTWTSILVTHVYCRPLELITSFFPYKDVTRKGDLTKRKRSDFINYRPGLNDDLDFTVLFNLIRILFNFK